MSSSWPPATMLSLVHNYITSKVSITEKSIFFTSQIASLTLNFSTIWLIECWLMLVTQHQNRNRVYSSVILILMTLCWHQHHILNHALVWNMYVYPLQPGSVHLLNDISWSTLAYTLVFEISTRPVLFFVVQMKLPSWKAVSCGHADSALMDSETPTIPFKMSNPHCHCRTKPLIKNLVNSALRKHASHF